MDFSDALRAIKRGDQATRAGWNGPGQYIQFEDTNRFPNTLMYPFLAIRTVGGKLAPWVPSCTDLLSEDWEILPTHR